MTRLRAVDCSGMWNVECGMWYNKWRSSSYIRSRFRIQAMFRNPQFFYGNYRLSNQATSRFALNATAFSTGVHRQRYTVLTIMDILQHTLTPASHLLSLLRTKNLSAPNVTSQPAFRKVPSTCNCSLLAQVEVVVAVKVDLLGFPLAPRDCLLLVGR